ncbi:hypothetical protein PFTANZ_06598 [Plasmodium falciparum Tanzania (2000708)]|uniref:Duffy-antigen binding domain-containing protein n=1 Tax=Plasmodium falciparum Tanzania (2000708) TaxID=1036725 RepID=A0A024VW30_PLAFA|nr:hypothetical protein PFTANZ_06598 [Plasmodium falciparum Tanzania (2000708)]
MLDKEEAAVLDILGGGENKTTIDKLLNHEEEIATECKQDCEKRKAPSAGEDRGRSDAVNPDDRSQQPAEEEEEEDEDEEEDDVEDDEGDEPVETPEGEEEATVAEGPQGPSATPPEVKPCDIVATLFNDTSKFSDACKLKYGPGGKEKFPNWKCIPSDTKSVATSGDQKATDSESERLTRQRRSADSAVTPTTSGDTTGGSICIPPRRRRLYVGKLEEWADKQVGNTETQPPQDGAPSQPQPQDQTPSPSDGKPASQDPSEKLRTAFIQSAAIETFFLWDRYKKIKDKEKKEKEEQARQNGGLDTPDRGTLENSDDPQTQLKSGTIPNDFLRQMFYTLGDYRDILVRGVADDKNGDNNIVVNASGTEDQKTAMETIQAKIQQILSQNGDKLVQKPSDKRTALWGDFAQPIWNGMIYALTYKEDTRKTPKGQRLPLRHRHT